MRRLTLRLLLLLTAGLSSLPALAEYVIIVHPDTNVNLTQQDVERIFLAKTKTFPQGGIATPVNCLEGEKIRVTFDQRVIGKNESQMKSYWAKLIFTGKALPIKQLSCDREIVEFVAKHPGAIGYVDINSADNSVRKLFSF